MIEGYVSDKVRSFAEQEYALITAPARSKRSPEDFALRKGNHTAWIDVKTKDRNGVFSMPNLISIQRLWTIFEAQDEDLVFLFVDYSIVDQARGVAVLDRVHCVPAEDMNPEALQIQNLGLGQLQMRVDVSSAELLRARNGPGLREALPGMASAFHGRQAEKSLREARIWTSRLPG